MRVVSAAVVLCAALAGCSTFALPGHLPLVGPPPAPIEPEPMHCGALKERPVAPSPVGQPILGAADFHNHQFANLGFGGRFLWGATYDERGIAPALSSCGVDGLCLDDREATLCREVACRLTRDADACRAECDRRRCATSPPHGHFGLTDPVGAVLSDVAGHTVSGYPDFEGWPHFNTYTHQQVYHRWLRRAFDGGLKLIVMHAVSNEVLCKFLGHAHACDDMTNVDKQLDAALELEKAIDYENDCAVNGNGWYRIARSPQQARAIIASGAMAVVLGIEVDSLFNCPEGACRLETGAGSRQLSEAVRAQIAKYKDKGVTHLFPVHLFDNAFGGTAADSDFFNFGNVVINHKLLSVEECPNKTYEFHFDHASSAVDDLLDKMAAFFGIAYDGYPKHGPHCNKNGLTCVGEAVVQALMNARIIIDVDHMSTLSRGKVLELAEGRGYPGLVSGHSGFTDICDGQKKHEGQLTPEEVTRLVKLGGLVAPILNQGDREEIHTYPHASDHPIASDCGNSAKSFAQAYLYAIDHSVVAPQVVDLQNYPPSRGIGFGSDLNGLAGSPTPRFGPYACGGDRGAEQSGKVSYPFALYPGLGEPMEQSQAGHRKFDINVDGFAHVGMFPDFVAELSALGLTTQELFPLFSAAEAYIQLWERTEQAPEHPAVTCTSPR